MPDDNKFVFQGESFKFPGEQGFFDKSKIVRYIVLAVFSLSLFAYLHFREVQVDIPELNSVASNYVVAQVDFSFPDDEATVILRQDALRDVGKIYQISQRDVRNKRIEFENFLLYNQAWHEQTEGGMFQELYQASEIMEKALIQLRFTDPLTLAILKKQGVSIRNYQVYSPNTLLDKSLLPEHVWEEIQKQDFSPTSFDPLITALVMGFFQNSHWPVEEDIPSQRLLRKRVQAEVPEKLTRVNAGNRILDQGDKVTTRHIAMLQSMKDALGDSRHLLSLMPLLGSFLLTLLLLGIFISSFKALYPEVLYSNRKLFLLVTVFMITMLLSKLTEFFILNSRSSLVDIFRYPLVIPLAAILLCSLINSRIAAFSIGFMAIVSTFALAFEWEGFLLLNLVFSIVAILSIRSLRRRKEIIVVSLKAFCCTIIAIFAFHLYTNHISYVSVLSDIFSTSFFMLVTVVLVVGLLPLLETTFNIVTDVTLMEYMDPNNDLLRRLTIEAPGTYQHSVVVGNLAEAAAISIGANGLFCRVATLYHDVGKMTTSQCFTENQLGEVNIHQLLTPQESAQVIMSHVPEGVLLAREAGLTESIIDIIKEHHGTTLVYYFYCKQVEKMGGDKGKVDEREFRYPGPKPRSKESGIIMVADSFEAASRSLDKVNEITLNELVNRIVVEKINDGQFDECTLTFSELCIIKQVLVKTLLAAGHSRIKYPSLEKKKCCEPVSDSSESQGDCLTF